MSRRAKGPARARTVWLGRDAVARLRVQGDRIVAEMAGGRYLGEAPDDATALAWIAGALDVSVGRLAVDAGDLREMIRRDR